MQDVSTSNSAENLGEPVAAREGNEAVAVIDCKNTKGRYIRIVRIGTTHVWYWSIHKLDAKAQ